MNKNLGNNDRILRLLIAIVLLYLAFIINLLIVKIFLVLLGFFTIYEAYVGWCALYAIVGRNTCPIKLPKNMKVDQQGVRKKKIVIVGAGPGGLSAGMILASQGFDVCIFEKETKVGGRNAPLFLGDFIFDIGPTFIILPQVFREIFLLAGRRIENYLSFQKIDPMYRLRYKDGRDFLVHNDKEKLMKEIAHLFPGEEKGYKKWLKNHAKKFELTYDCLKVPYNKIYHYMRWKLLKALTVMQLHKSVYGVLEKYFKTTEMKMAMAFQSKYLGMSPYDCPGAFSILSYTEHGFGIYHTLGGVHKISEAMAKVIGEYDGKIELNKTISEILVVDGKAKGVKFENGEIVDADIVIANADFAYAMKNLVKEQNRPSYSDKKLENMKYSCSTFMIYFGLGKKYNIPHHNIFFGGDYKKNVEQIFSDYGMPEDPAFYIQNPSIIDSELAPEGKSTIYVLVPVSNLNANFPWEERKIEIRNLLVELIKSRTELKDFDKYIEVEHIITPKDWEKELNVYKGATFNLSHNIGQMLYMRPHNQFNNINNMYLVGGGTHPGSGLPTILESGRIVADMIVKESEKN